MMPCFYLAVLGFKYLDDYNDCCSIVFYSMSFVPFFICYEVLFTCYIAVFTVIGFFIWPLHRFLKKRYFLKVSEVEDKPKRISKRAREPISPRSSEGEDDNEDVRKIRETNRTKNDEFNIILLRKRKRQFQNYRKQCKFIKKPLPRRFG